MRATRVAWTLQEILHTACINKAHNESTSPGKLEIVKQDPITGRLIYHYCEQMSKVDLRHRLGFAIQGCGIVGQGIGF